MRHSTHPEHHQNIERCLQLFLYDRCTGKLVPAKPPEYERSSKRLSEFDVGAAISYSQSDEIAGKVVEWRDLKAVGLTLRMTPRKAVWYVRRREITLRLAAASDLALEDARYFADQISLAARRKRDLRAFVQVLLSYPPPDPNMIPDARFNLEMEDRLVRGMAAREKAKRPPPRPDTPFWTWKTLTDEYLKYQKPKLKEKYRKAYEHYLTLNEFSSINDKMVRDIKLRDLERLRDAIHLDHAPSAVHRALTQSKRMLSWAWRYHATVSGLEDVQAEWWNRWSYEYETRERTHAPTIEEIARTLVVAEQFRHLAKGEHDTYPGTLGALWGIALTAQRTGAFLQLRHDRMFDAAKVQRKLRGWKIANWTQEEMKGGRDGGRPHSLPLPSEALKILAKFHAEAGGSSEWMFPGRDPAKHVTPSALNLLMYRLQGRVYDHTVKQKPSRKGKPGPKPRPKKERRNLFADYGIRRWTLHDSRRTMTTFLDDRKLGGAATAILGHKTAHHRDDERQKLAAITEQHYNRSQKIELKSDGMALWVKALLSAYEKELKKFKRQGAPRRMAA
jgi:integrase